MKDADRLRQSVGVENGVGGLSYGDLVGEMMSPSRTRKKHAESWLSFTRLSFPFRRYYWCTYYCPEEREKNIGKSDSDMSKALLGPRHQHQSQYPLLSPYSRLRKVSHG